ncbi:MAG: V-type ATP synthase subunit I [Oscillospiraceae bacterium]
MAIVKMKRLKLVAVKSQRDTLLHELMLLGCVQISEPGEQANEGELQGFLKKETAGLSERRAAFEQINWGLQVLGKYAPAKSGLFTPKPGVERRVILDSSAIGENLALAKKIDQTDDQIKRIIVEESRVRGLIETLEPWAPMDVPFELSETKTCFVTQGTVPASVSVSELEAALFEVAPESRIFPVSRDSTLHYLLLVGMKENQQEFMETVRKFGFSPSSLSNMSGTAAANIADCKNRLASLDAEKKALSSEIIAAAASRNELQLCSDRLLTIVEQADNAERLLYSSSTINFEGWIPAEEEASLAPLLSKFDCAWEISEPSEADIPDVPIKLKGNFLTTPFTMLTEMYSLPAYNGIDPNPLIMPFFSMFFGIMFADMGYGLMILLAGLVFKFKAKPTGTRGYFAGLMIICGISSALFGLLSGSFFGDCITQIASMYGKTAALPALINPLTDPMTVLIASLILGFIQLMFGTFVNAYMQIRDGHPLDAVLDAGPVVLLFVGIGVGAMGVTWYVALAGVLSIVFTSGRASPSIGGKLGGGIYGLYNVVSGWFGDVLSYCRLMALMLSGAVIASVFNTLGALTGNLFGFILLFLVGHALNFALSIIGTFVHALRLQYLEFFGKFYIEGGKPYTPLAIKTNYVNIIKEDLTHAGTI